MDSQAKSQATVTMNRTHASPAEECNAALKANCIDDKEISQSGIREIGTAVIRLNECKMLHLVDENEIMHFLQIQNQILLKSKDFPIDLVEISLKFLGAPDMPLRIYNDEWITNIIKKLHEFCFSTLFVESKEPSKLHRLLPLLTQLSKIVQQITFTDSIIVDLISIAIPSYLLQESSPSLQTAACSLMTSIFKRYSQFRQYLIEEIFSSIKKHHGTPKILIFSNNTRKYIQPITRIILEFVQSITSFPCDTENVVKELMKEIIEYFFVNSLNNNTFYHLFEQFIEDLGTCLTHPFYPSSEQFLKTSLEYFFQRMTKDSKTSRISIKLSCISLTSITLCSHKSKEETEVTIPISVLHSISDFRKEQIDDIINTENSHLTYVDNNYILMKINPTFPSNLFEKILSRFIICLFLTQSFKYSNTSNTALPFHISQWSLEEMTIEETNNYLLWWRGTFPENVFVELSIDITEKLYINDISKHSMFENVHLLIQHLLRGLSNKNSSIRSNLLRGFSSIIEIEPTLLYHPLLVSQIQNAFLDPTASIRDAVLEIITNYISQNEQYSSPYFNVVLNCLADSSPMVVKRALTTISKFTNSADDNNISSLCYFLSLKLQDPLPNVANSAKSSFIQAFFGNAKDKGRVLIQVISKYSERPKWFPIFFKEIFLKYHQEIKDIIQEIVDIVCIETTYQSVFLLREFSEIFPMICSNYHERLFSLFISCQDNQILNILPYVLIAIIPEIQTPNLTMIGLTLKPMEQIICSKPSNIVRPVIELCSKIIQNIFPDSTILSNIQNQFSKFLRNNIRNINSLNNPEMETLTNQITRALFVSGCIYRYYGAEDKEFGKALWGIVTNYFRSKIPKIRTIVLQCACDICIRSSDFIKNAKGIVTAAFQLGPPESISALIFLKSLLIEESQAEDNTAIDEIRPLYSSNLHQTFMKQIQQSFFSIDSNIRTAALELTRVSLLYGMTDPHNLIPYVITMLCSKEQCNLAKEVLKEIMNNYSDALLNRINDGIKLCFQYVEIITNNNLNLYNLDDIIYHFGDLYPILNDSLRKSFLDIIIHICKDSITSGVNPMFFKWLMNSVMNIPFSLAKEPIYLIQQLNQNTSMIITSVFSDARSVISEAGESSDEEIIVNSDPSTWYASILLLRTKHWLLKKYQINIKKLDKLKDKIPVKVALIQNIDMSNVPIPLNQTLSDSMLDLFACFQSAMRMERSLAKKSEEKKEKTKKSKRKSNESE